MGTNEKYTIQEYLAEIFDLEKSKDNPYLSNYHSIKKLIKNLSDISGQLKTATNKEKELFFFSLFISNNLLCDEIEDDYDCWVKSFLIYLEYIQKSSNYLEKCRLGLFLFGENLSESIDGDKSFAVYKECYRFSIENNKEIYWSDTFNSVIVNLQRSLPLKIENDLCVQRILDILSVTFDKSLADPNDFPYFYYFLLLRSTYPPAQSQIKTMKSLSDRKVFCRQIERVEYYAENYFSKWCDKMWQKDYEFQEKQYQEELSKRVVLPFVTELGLIPKTLSWKLNILFSTVDFDCWEDYSNLTNGDARMELCITSNNRWVVDLQWFNPEEACHDIRHPGKERKRIIWRNMYTLPISNSAIKNICPELTSISDFPALVLKIEELFNLNFHKKVKIIFNGLVYDDSKFVVNEMVKFEVVEKAKPKCGCIEFIKNILHPFPEKAKSPAPKRIKTIEEWLSPCADKFHYLDKYQRHNVGK